MKKTFADGVALGVFLTLLAILLLALLFDFHFFGRSEDSYIQTILTSLAAIGAAYLALWGIRHQIQQNFEIEKSQRLQSLSAARASLPLALSELVTKAREVIDRILDGSSPSPQNLVDSISDPTILETLSKCIEFSDYRSSDRLAQIIRYVQLVRARFETSYFSNIYPKHESNWSIVVHNRTSYIIDWAVLAAICNSAFPFARGAEASIPAQITEYHVRNALITSGTFPEEYPRLNQLIEERSRSNQLERDFRVR